MNLSEESVILCYLTSIRGPVWGEVSEQVVKGSGVVHDSLVYPTRGKVQDIFIHLKDFFPSIDKSRIWGRLLVAPFNLGNSNFN